MASSFLGAPRGNTPVSTFHANLTQSGYTAGISADQLGSSTRRRSARKQIGSMFTEASADASKQRDEERARKPTSESEPVRLTARSPEPAAGSYADLHRHRQRQLLRAQTEVATIMEALGMNEGNEVVHVKRELVSTQRKLVEAEQQLDSAREELRAKAARERDLQSTSRALNLRTHEQRDYIAAVELQLTTTRTTLQVAESRISDMMTFKQRSEHLTHQLGQERQRNRKKDETISELLQREEALQRQVATLILQRDASPARKDLRRQMKQLQDREGAMSQVLAAVAGTVPIADVPSRAWEDEDPTLHSPMWRQPQLGLEPEPEPEPAPEPEPEQSISPRPPGRRPSGNGGQMSGRKGRRRRSGGGSKLRGKKSQIEQMKRRLRSMSYSEKGQDPASLFMLYDANNSGSLELNEFRSAVRKGGQLTKGLISDEELETLFHSVDADRNGNVSIRELTKFIWGDDEQVAALLEEELHGFAKALETSSDEDELDEDIRAGAAGGVGEDSVNDLDLSGYEGGRGGTAEEQAAQRTDGENEGAQRQGQQRPASTNVSARSSGSGSGRKSASPRSSLYSPRTGRLLRRPSGGKNKAAGGQNVVAPVAAVMLPTPQELTQLGYSMAKLVDGQQYWFSLKKPAQLHWDVPPELVAALRRLRAEEEARAGAAAERGEDGEGFFTAAIATAAAGAPTLSGGSAMAATP
jgi:hypothetical protein